MHGQNGRLTELVPLRLPRPREVTYVLRKCPGENSNTVVARVASVAKIGQNRVADFARQEPPDDDGLLACWLAPRLEIFDALEGDGWIFCARKFP